MNASDQREKILLRFKEDLRKLLIVGKVCLIAIQCSGNFTLISIGALIGKTMEYQTPAFTPSRDSSSH